MAERTRRVAVIGGGIAGLAAAWEAIGHDGVEVEVHEAGDRFGGRIATTALPLSTGDLAVDEGADAFLARVPDALDLCRELGIETELVSPATGRAQVLAGGVLRDLPSNSVLGVPLDLDDLAATGIVSAEGLDRVGAEVGRAGAPPIADVTIGAFLTERLGAEVVDHLVGPLIGGINAGDVHELSMRAVTPQLADAAADGGSLIEALRRGRQNAPLQGPVFLAPVGGMGRLVEAVVDGCRSRGVRLSAGSSVNDLESIDADVVIVTTPAPITARLVEPVSSAAAKDLNQIAHASVVLTTFAFDHHQVPDSDHSGFLVPRDAGLTMTAASYGSNKWRHWDDGTHAVIRVSAGHAGNDRAIGLGDDALVAELLDELRAHAGITGDPVAVRLSRFRDGFAQYEVGHLDRVERIDASLRADAPRIRLAGAALRGVGVPACIRHGRDAARALLGGSA